MWRPITGTGESIYSGEKIELAGKLFHRIEDFGTFQMPPPMPEVVSSGVRVYNEELNLSISLEQKFDESVPASASSKLMQLSLQGQSGFGDEQPRFGCETLSSLSMQSLQGILA
ncbi:MAG: hypothetical protein B7Z10_09810 [Rhodobacterales bacterium 32-66-7]|nr:MAG: hypothetical protein B7Z10_09810 [Rhodobacterales bacterium 32-66-7]